jgi:hypothetical protein
MPQIASPPPPALGVALADEDRSGRLHAQLWLWWMTFLTVLATAWCFTLGPIPAIISIVAAKHVLVALLVMGMDLRAQSQAD